MDEVDLIDSDEVEETQHHYEAAQRALAMTMRGSHTHTERPGTAGETLREIWWRDNEVREGGFVVLLEIPMCIGVPLGKENIPDEGPAGQ